MLYNLIVRWQAAIIILSSLSITCETGEPPPRVVGAARPARASAGGRLFVLRLEPAGVALLHRAALRRAPRPLRARPRSHRGGYVVRDGGGRALSRGFFYLPTRIHAVFDRSGSPDVVDTPLRRPVIRLRVAWPVGARTLELWAGSRRLGEVTE